MMKKMKESKGKGFTLVELIVVLVILAILAALLIPALTGYIDRAKRKNVVAETRQAVTAAQTIADEKYAALVVSDATAIKFSRTKETDEVNDNSAIITEKSIKSLAEVDGNITELYITSGKVTLLVYEKNGIKCTYNPASTTGTDGSYNVE